MVKQSYKKSGGVRTVLLDTAEDLFAQKGYFGTSIRDITEKADVRNASVNYHFVSKEKLFEAVIERRIDPIAQARIALLHDVEINSAEPQKTVTDIVNAFASPLLEFSLNGGAGWKNYCTLIAHLGVQKIWTESTVSTKFDNNALEFIQALSETFPNADMYKIHCSFQFMLSTTLYAVCDNKRIDTVSEGQYQSSDIKRLRAPFMDFIVSGILGVIAE